MLIKKRLIYAIFTILLLVILTALGIYKAMHTMPEIIETNIYGNSSGNLNNRGLVAKQGKWLYLRYPWNINFFGKDSIYRVSVDGKEKHHITFDEANKISVYGEWIYYCPVRLSPVPYYLYRVKLDGSRKGVIISEVVYSYIIYNNQIFYTTEAEGKEDNTIDLCLSDINGKNKYIIASGNIGDFTISKNKIFYVIKKNNDYELISCDFKGLNKASLHKGKYMINIIFDNGWLYYILKDNEILAEGQIYKMDEKGEKITGLYQGDIWHFNVHDEWIIIRIGKGLYRMSTVTKEVKKIIDGYNIKSYCIHDKYIYFYSTQRNKSNKTYIYRVDIEGNGLIRLN